MTSGATCGTWTTGRLVAMSCTYFSTLETSQNGCRKIAWLLNDGKCEIVTDDANVVTKIRARPARYPPCSM